METNSNHNKLKEKIAAQIMASLLTTKVVYDLTPDFLEKTAEKSVLAANILINYLNS